MHLGLDCRGRVQAAEAFVRSEEFLLGAFRVHNL